MNRSPTTRSGLPIIFEDRDIILIDKPAGLLTMGTETDKTHTAYFQLTDYVRKGQLKSRRRIFIVHRLDRETSGVLLFAKTEQAKRRLQDGWDDVEKIYLALVHGQMAQAEGILESYLAENSVHVVYVTNDTLQGKLARTSYRVLKHMRDQSLLELNLLTGRKHQIRVQLASVAHPVVGDKKYGKSGDPARRLALHARSITFAHPGSGRRLTFQADIPSILNP